MGDGGGEEVDSVCMYYFVSNKSKITVRRLVQKNIQIPFLNKKITLPQLQAVKEK